MIAVASRDRVLAAAKLCSFDVIIKQFCGATRAVALARKPSTALFDSILAKVYPLFQEETTQAARAPRLYLDAEGRC